MANNCFTFKKFTIHQDQTAMKVGTDGVLLGAWANVPQKGRILDVGTGTGLIAMMLAQRTGKEARIDAVEIDASSFRQATMNAQNSPWSNQIKIFHSSFQKFSSNAKEKYDTIVSNPPFFTNAQNAKEASRTKARNANYLPFETLIQGSKNLLLPHGTLCVILPIHEGNQFIEQAKTSGFFLQRQTLVFPNPQKTAKRHLLEFSFNSGKKNFNHLTVETKKRHVYTDQYVKLCKDFYLGF